MVFVADKDKILLGTNSIFIKSTVTTLWTCHDGDWPADLLFWHAING